MPTDLSDKEQDQAQATFMVLIIVCLVFLALLLVDENFSQAAVELMRLF